MVPLEIAGATFEVLTITKYPVGTGDAAVKLPFIAVPFGVPVLKIKAVGAAVGAVANYQLIKKLGKTAMMAYRMRILKDKHLA
mgnify:CR=1 FL=1